MLTAELTCVSGADTALKSFPEVHEAISPTNDPSTSPLPPSSSRPLGPLGNQATPPTSDYCFLCPPPPKKKSFILHLHGRLSLEQKKFGFPTITQDFFSVLSSEHHLHESVQPMRRTLYVLSSRLASRDALWWPDTAQWLWNPAALIEASVLTAAAQPEAPQDPGAN